jgi:hypothetical protein
MQNYSSINDLNARCNNQELILKDYKNKIKISDFSKYLNRLIDIIIKKF